MIAQALSYPPLEQRPEDVAFGGGTVRYVDPYRWLEEDSDEDVITWQNAQDDLARTHLASLPRY
jgi:prolyl oligopeptidase